MLDLALREQFDRMLFSVLLGLVVTPLWLLSVRIGGRKLWRRILEATVQLLLVLAAVGGLGVGTSLSLRGWVFIGFGFGLFTSVALVRGIDPPWQEFRRRRRN